MKKSALYVLLLLVILIVAVVVCVGALRSDAEAPQPTLPPVTAAPGGETPLASPEESPGETTETPQPEETPIPTEPPVFETKEPIVETTPEPTPKPVASASGSFVSNTGTGLNMKVVWETYTAADGSAKLRVDVYATHYSFNTSALYNAVTVTIGGRAYSMNSAEVSYDGDALAESLIATCTVDAPAGGVTIDVVWDYRGSYSGVELETIEASGYASIG
ncbi:MAG: hypothetical protein ACI4PC_09120 [Oscillospiraceae bacterium]